MQENEINGEDIRNKEERSALLAALKRKACGYTVSETTTEYDAEGNEIKNKITTKEVPPDLAALKMLLDEGDGEEMSEEELEAERDRLIKELSALVSNKKRGKK